ncbi:MAG: 50S ribosomal protein L6 [Fidelibacterota bacterium]
MSRIGKEPIKIPDDVKVDIHSNMVSVNGPKGELLVNIHPAINIDQKNDLLHVSRSSDIKSHRALHGTSRVLVANAIKGVSEGYKKELEIRGVGYQAKMEGNRLVLQLGYSHDIVFDPPEGIDINANRDSISISGIDKQMVGEIAAKIRSFRKPEPYKGKGIRYKDEYVRSKQGKTVGGSD